MNKTQISTTALLPLLSFKDKLSYGVGDYAANLSWILAQIYLMYFYTDVFGISAAQAALIFGITRIWDAINDPVMGFISDHTQSRWGKFRPYLLFGAIPLGIVTVLTFTTPDLGPTGKFVWALTTYLLLSMMFTVVTLSMVSLTAVMTQDTNERNDKNLLF
jgi:GPH family glycoside/pentoside/hexuronide:cation symporter